MTRTDALIKATIRALNENRVLLDSLPESVTSIQLDVKLGRDNLAFSVHVAARWQQSMALASVGAPCDVSGYKFTT